MGEFIDMTSPFEKRFLADYGPAESQTANTLDTKVPVISESDEALRVLLELRSIVGRALDKDARVFFDTPNGAAALLWELEHPAMKAPAQTADSLSGQPSSEITDETKQANRYEKGISWFEFWN